MQAVLQYVPASQIVLIALDTEPDIALLETKAGVQSVVVQAVNGKKIQLVIPANLLSPNSRPTLTKVIGTRLADTAIDLKHDHTDDHRAELELSTKDAVVLKRSLFVLLAQDPQSQKRGHRYSLIVGLLSGLIGWLDWHIWYIPLIYAYLGYGLTRTLHSHRRIAWQRLRIIKQFRPRHFAQVILMQASFTVVLAALYQIPVLHWSWLNLLGSEGANIIALPAQSHSRLAATGFILVLCLVIPLLAEWEERVFRLGKHTMRQWLVASVRFGLVHCLVGVPLAIGLALIVPGIGLAHIYLGAYRHYRRQEPTHDIEAKEAGVRASTRIHTLNNWLTSLYALIFVWVS